MQVGLNPRFSGSLQVTLLDNKAQRAVAKDDFTKALGKIAQEQHAEIKFHSVQITEKTRSAVLNSSGEHEIHEPIKMGYDATLYIDTWAPTPEMERAADNAVLGLLRQTAGPDIEFPKKLGAKKIDWFDSNIELRYSPTTKTPDYNAAPQKLW